MSALRRWLTRLRAPTAPHVLEPVRPKVTPDPERAAELERRRQALDYVPSEGFLTERAHRFRTDAQEQR